MQITVIYDEILKVFELTIHNEQLEIIHGEIENPRT
jgi:hypothetical protein